MPKDYTFSDDINGGGGGEKNGDDGGEMSPATAKGSGSGCFVSLVTGFVLTLLAVLIAVGVGLVVHFAERDGASATRDISCGFSPESMNDLLRLMQQQGAQTTASGTPQPPSTTTPTPTPTPSDADHDGYRLPSDLQPLHYDLELAPDIYGSDPTTFTFQGRVNITVKCLSPTRKVVLNAKNLSIAKSDIRVSGSLGGLQVVDMVLNDRMETLTLSLGEDLTKDETYHVQIDFSGPLTDDLSGMYLSSYQRGNQTVYLATTQFESPDAREAFPCFDEPAFKSTFSVTLLRKSPMVSLSNTQIKHTLTRADGWLADVYESTPAMSTYLLAFIVSDFLHINATTAKGTKFGIWARRELADMMEYALHTGMTVLDYYGEVFGTDFPLQKQDMVAIPDFAAGAMENWGLITYREKYLLYKANVTSEKERQKVTLVIAHELAHQWFGNLVTLAWWDDLWLNEGFAEFVEYIGMDKIDPSWKVWEQFNIDALQTAFEYDQTVTSHPLYSPAKTVEEMKQYFDTISYEKGASVIRMIELCLGEDTFRKGLQRYLREHQYANANHTDLWKALADQAREDQRDLDIADIMNTWTLQMGFPVISVMRNFRGDVIVSQKRFLINPEAEDPGVFTSQYGYQWHVPITLTSSAQPRFNVTADDVQWLSKHDKSKTFTPWVPMPGHADPDGWYLLNVQQKCYYRVNYDVSNWRALISQLSKDHKVISAVNRAQIIDDAWNLASAEELPVEIALSTLEYLEQEDDYVPWAAAATLLADLKTRMTGTSGYGALTRFIQDRTRPLFNKLGLDDTGAPALQSYTREVAVRLSCGAGVPHCVRSSVMLFQQWRQDPHTNPISPSVRRLVYCTAVKEGDEDDWLFVLTRLRVEQSPTDREYLRRALACSTRTWLLNKLLNMSLSGKDIRRDDATGVIADVATNDVGTRLAWDFVRANWDVIIRDFAQSHSRLEGMISAIVGVFRSQFFHQELQAFIQSKADLGSAGTVLSQAVELVEFNMKWYQNSYRAIVQWLAARGYKELEGTEADLQEVTPENVRLPTNLRPLHYELTIEPHMYDADPTTFTFNGTVALNFHCVEATDRIVLHIDELDVSGIQVTPSTPGQPGHSPRYLDHQVDERLQFLTLRMDTAFSPGINYTVRMEFSGALDGKTLSGLYLSSYRNATGETVYLATTQFEPTDARKAFPCMDEPALKASFSITVIRRSFNLALSNMPVQFSTNLGGERVADHFQMTKPMSTYLVAFIVCDFANKTKMTQRNIPYEVWSGKDVINQVDFALDFGVRAIDFYEDYFQVDFPLPKQSMAAIPDFAAGAMENWGLITYRETRILIQPGVSSDLDKNHAAYTIAHELGHMWFGDLVSPAWWDELWLNEGFATFVGYLAVDHLQPDWKQFDAFVTNVVHVAMDMDGRVSSHPVYVPVATPAQINEIFDAISYSKGAAIIRMIRFAIGEDTFRQGLENYLRTLAYRSASEANLWSALDAQALKDGRGIRVGDVMDTWTRQMNYPVVMVTVEGRNVTLRQERFLLNPEAKDPGKYRSQFGYKWDIPFTFTTSDNANFSVQAPDIHWLMRNEGKKSLTVSTLTPSSWLLGNVGVKGFYRVNYDTANWQKLASQLRHDATAIDPLNRAQIIDDAWSLASGGYIAQDVALSVVEYLDLETEYVPWVAATGQLNYVADMLSSTEMFGAFKAFMANKTSGQYSKLGRNPVLGGLVESKLRSLIVRTACENDGADCVTDALALFRDWKANPDNNTIPPEVRGAVYCAVLRRGGAEDWQFLYQRYLAESDVSERDRLLAQLSCTSELWVLRRLLNRALEARDIRSQDSLRVVSAVALNPAGTALAWDSVRDSWDDIMNRYHSDPFLLKRLITAFGSVFNTPIQLQEMQAFVDSHPDLGVATRAFQAAMESARGNIRWMEKNYGSVKAWLQRQGFVV